MFTEHVIMKYRECNVVPFARRLQIVSHCPNSMGYCMCAQWHVSLVCVSSDSHTLCLSLQHLGEEPDFLMCQTVDKVKQVLNSMRQKLRSDFK